MPSGYFRGLHGIEENRALDSLAAGRVRLKAIGAAFGKPSIVELFSGRHTGNFVPRHAPLKAGH